MATGNRGGRPRKPTEVHLLAGNPGKIADLEAKAAAEPHPEAADPLAPPAPPKHLPKEARDCWKMNVAMLAQNRLLTEADMQAFEAYCVAYWAYRKALKDLKKANRLTLEGVATNGAAKLTERPEAVSLRAYMKEMREWAREFGMTPAARGRMVLPEKDAEEDEMDKLLRGEDLAEAE